MSLGVLLLLAACGGKVEAEPVTCEPPADVCVTMGSHARGSFLCANEPGIGYACCGYTQDEVDALKEHGDTIAAQCIILDAPSAH